MFVTKNETTVLNRFPRFIWEIVARASGCSKQFSVPSWKRPKVGMVILSIIFLGGCASTSVQNTEQFMGEGFHVSLPQPRERVVVWGNHSGAVTRALSWLHDKDLIVVDPSWVEKGFKDPGFARRTRAQQKSQVLAIANDVGASVVVFTYVEENQLARKFDVMSWSNKTLKIVNVEIRGMNTQTGDVMFGSKVWNSEPVAISEDFILDLTTMGLEKAWKQKGSPPMLVENETPIQGDTSEPQGERDQVTVYPEGQTSEKRVIGKLSSGNRNGCPRGAFDSTGEWRTPRTTRPSSGPPGRARSNPRVVC